MDRLAGGSGQLLPPRLGNLLRQAVGLVQAEQLRPIQQAWIIGAELVPDGAPGGADVVHGAVDQMDQHPAALDMAEEAIAQAGAFVRPLDQARDVGDHEAVVVDRHRAELGLRAW